MKPALLAMSAMTLFSCGNMKEVEKTQENKRQEISKSVEDDAKTDFSSKSKFEINKNWWQDFNDLTLNKLIQQAVDQNLDLKLLIRLAEDVQKHEFRAENGQSPLFFRYYT